MVLRRAIPVLLLLIAGVMPGVAVAGQPLALAHLDTVVKIGERIRVVDTAGTALDGTFEGADVAGVRLRRQGRTVHVPAAAIRKVQVRRREGDGVLIGLGIGAALGLGFVKNECSRSSERRDCRYAGNLIITLPAAAVGGLVDHGFKRYRTVYER